MKTASEFVINYWEPLAVLLWALIRLIPTKKNFDVFAGILKILDVVVPNLKKTEKGVTRHN